MLVLLNTDPSCKFLQLSVCIKIIKKNKKYQKRQLEKAHLIFCCYILLLLKVASDHVFLLFLNVL